MGEGGRSWEGTDSPTSVSRSITFSRFISVFHRIISEGAHALFFNTHLKLLNITIGVSLPINEFPLFTQNNTILYLLNLTFEINAL